LNVEYNSDGLAVFKGKTGPTKRSFNSHLKKFYETNRQPTEMHRKIAQLPFHLIISMSPDTMLQTAFEEMGLSHDFRYYRKTENPEKIDRLPSKRSPLIYNLFGKYEDEDSLVATQNDIIEFLFAILGGFKLPMGILTPLKAAKVFLFMGFDFEKWYLKVLLKLLDL
jgi:hypothetical protein